MATATLDTKKVPLNLPALPDELPDNVEACHALLHSFAHQASSLIEALAGDAEQYKQRVDYLLRRLFGASSEKLDPNQLLLFKEALEQAVLEAEQSDDEAPESVQPSAPSKRKGHGRQRLPEDLPRQRIEHDIADEDKVCPNGHERVRIGEDVSEQLDYTPASYYVIEHVRPVYACNAPACDCGVAQAAKPAQPIEKGMAGPGLLAHTITSKYCDHRVPGEAAHVMRVGPSQPGCRPRLQTTLSGAGQEPGS